MTRKHYGQQLDYKLLKDMNVFICWYHLYLSPLTLTAPCDTTAEIYVKR
jgi:hypothetical protein